jgi:TolB protein
MYAQYRFADEAIHNASPVTAEECKTSGLDLSFVCGYPSDTELYWEVDNPLDFEIEFTWEVEGSDPLETGTETVGASGSVNFGTSLGDKNVILYVNGNKVDQAESGEACYEDLELDFQCLPPGLHYWTVSNSNDFDQSFTWSSTTGASGSDSVPAGGSVNMTTGIDAQTMTISYQHGELPEKSVEAEAEVCDAPSLLLTYICGYPSDTELIWRVRNSHDFDVAYTWDVYGSSESGDGIAPANSDTFFTTSLGDKTVRLFVYDQLVNTKAGGSICKVDLELDFQCLVTGLHEWTVTNGNDFDQEFTWSSTNGESGTGTAPANGTASFITGLELQTVTITYQNYVHPEKTVEVIAEACKSPELDLVYDCGYPTDSVLYWYVSNPLDVDVDFTWEVVGDTEKGSGTALANANTYFTTSTGLKSVKILVEGYEIDLEDGGESCMVELSISFTCLDNGTQEWTVTNLNKDEQSFAWSSDSGTSGSGVAPAGGSYSFTTANIDQEITIEYKHDPFPAQSNVAYGEVCKISTPEPEPEPPTTYGVSDVGTCQEWIVFHTMRDGNMEIYRLDGIEGVGDFALFNLSNGDGIDARPSRSFNDAWVAFQSNRDGNYEIYYGDTAGSQQIRLTDNEADDINAMFSPDNVHILFQSNRNGNWDLYMVNRLTGEETQLTDAESDEINPFFSNNQNFLVFETNKNGNQDIYLLNIVTGDEYKVATSEVDEVAPALSPNGQKVSFLSSVDGVMQLFVIDIDGDNKIQITDGDGDTNYHAWSPDSTRLAYQSTRDGNMDIYTYDLRDNTEYRVTEGEVDDIGPTWDCGGVNLAFTSTSSSGDLNIYQVFWKGGASSQMTIDPAADQWSEWSPAKETASRDN